MIKLFGLLKVALVVGLDFFVIYYALGSMKLAVASTAIVILYIWLGGYLTLLKEGAVSAKKLPAYEKNRLDASKARLIEDVKNISGLNISRIKLYLVPGDDTMNATAYGANCVSVTKGTFHNTDPVTLNAVLSHEISHIVNYDAEFHRAVFCTVTLLVGAISIISAVSMIAIFLIFLILSCFRSWLGVLAFQGTTKAVGGIFRLFQRAIVMTYRTILSFISRQSEYRSDKYACQLGYGIQLSHFLSLAEPYTQRQMTLSEALYRSHPPAEKRIARLEAQINR